MNIIILEEDRKMPLRFQRRFIMSRFISSHYIVTLHLLVPSNAAALSAASALHAQLDLEIIEHFNRRHFEEFFRALQREVRLVGRNAQ